MDNEQESPIKYPCSYPIKAIGHYADDFADIIIRAGEMGQLVRLKDVATIELGSIMEISTENA